VTVIEDAKTPETRQRVEAGGGADPRAGPDGWEAGTLLSRFQGHAEVEQMFDTYV